MEQEQQRTKVLIGLLSHHGNFHPDMLKSLDKLVHDSIKGGLTVNICKTFGSIIPGNRNDIAKRALEDNYDYLLFIDSDMVFDGNFLIELLNHKRDIVSGLCVSRVPPFRPVALVLSDDGKYRPREKLNEGRFYSDLDAIGCAFMLINVDVFRKIKFTWFAMPELKMFVQYDELLNDLKLLEQTGDKKLRKVLNSLLKKHNNFECPEGLMGEDVYFCRKARMAGYDICVDTSLIVGHVGERAYTLYDHLDYTQRAKGEGIEVDLSSFV